MWETLGELVSGTVVADIHGNRGLSKIRQVDPRQFMKARAGEEGQVGFKSPLISGRPKWSWIQSVLLVYVIIVLNFGALHTFSRVL